MQQISVYVIDKGEVNFIAINDEVEEYYQVAYTVKDAAGKILERDSDCSCFIVYYFTDTNASCDRFRKQYSKHPFG